MMNRDVPFPQANDFEKVITVLNTDEEKLKNYESMCIALGDITSRQVDYYVSACIYLGLITKEKTFTELGLRIRSLTGVRQEVALARILVADEVFGTVYFLQKMLGVELENSDVVKIMKNSVFLSTEKMYVRRASTVMSWVKWILSKEKKE